jgi:TRAP-type C4-dicarboxylate transport system substrate-binding protein
MTTSTVALIALLAAACGSSGASTDDAMGAQSEPAAAAEPAAGGETFEWDYVLFVGLEHHYGQLAQEFADDVRERTDGRLDITVRPAGELPYGADEYLARTGDGSMEMADALATFMAGGCRVGAMPALPMLVPDFETFDEIWPILEPEVEGCIQASGADLLYTYLWPTQNVWGSGEPVDSIDDVAGLTIRQTSPEHGAMIEAMGGEAVTLTTEEVPPAIQRGVMDGLLTAALNAWSGSWYEFLDWAYIVDAGIVPSYILVNADAYESLPEDLRAALDEAAAAATERNNTRTVEAEQEARELLQSEGSVTFNQASDEERTEIAEMMEDIWTTWAEGAGATPVLEEVRAAVER